MSHLFRRATHHPSQEAPVEGDRQSTKSNTSNHSPSKSRKAGSTHTISPEKRLRLPPAGDLLHFNPAHFYNPNDPYNALHPPVSLHAVPPHVGSTHTLTGVDPRIRPVDLATSPPLHRSYSYGVASPLNNTTEQRFVPDHDFDFDRNRMSWTMATGPGAEILAGPHAGEESKSPTMSSPSPMEIPGGGPSLAMRRSASGSVEGCSPKSRSNASTPNSPSSQISKQIDDKRRHSPRQNGGIKARKESSEDVERRKGRVERELSKSASPSQFDLQLPSTGTTYPGLVLGDSGGEGGDGRLGFGPDAMRFDGSMDDILDFSQTRDGRHGSASGQAGANIAPWLTDDAAGATDLEAEHSETITPSGTSRNTSSQALSHFSSVPSLPKIRPQGTNDEARDSDSSNAAAAGGPGPSSSKSSTRESSRSRLVSGDSGLTMSAHQRGKKPSLPDSLIMPGGRHGSVAQATRLGRLASNASSMGNASIGSEKKRGFLGVFKRKPTNAGLTTSEFHSSIASRSHLTGLDLLPHDFTPTNGSHRQSVSAGSTSSKLSTSTSMGSLSQKRSHPTMSELPSEAFSSSGERNQSYKEEMISPMLELGAHDFHLDMNLDDMEGIVDPTLANAPHTRMPTLPPGQSGATDSTNITNNSYGFDDALQQTSSYGTSVSVGGSSTGSAGSPLGVSNILGRSVVGEADRQGPFSRQNPFANSPTSSIEGNPAPPSPTALSPRHTYTLSTQPRRPSQLRNVKMGSLDSEVSHDPPDSAPLQPLAPAWASGGPPGATLFNDPFHGATGRPRTADGTNYIRPSIAGALDLHGIGQGTPIGEVRNGYAFAPAVATATAAWAAPESWGVEADAEPEETSSSSSDEGEAWTGDDFGGDVGDEANAPGSRYDTSPGPGSQKPPPFGFKSALKRGGKHGPPGGARSRAPAASGKATGSNRPGTGGRPGTSGSIHASTGPVSLAAVTSDGDVTDLG
jgi:adenylate cyclase